MKEVDRFSGLFLKSSIAVIQRAAGWMGAAIVCMAVSHAVG